MNLSRETGGEGVTRFLLIRHAESVWNAEGRWQGQGDPPLSARGRLAVAELGERLRPLGVEVLVASDLRRATETACLLGPLLGLEPRLHPELREWNVGSWSGLAHAEIERRFPADLVRVRDGDPDVRPGGGETRQELRERMMTFLSLLAKAEGGRRIAVVTHGGAIRSVCPDSRLGNLDFIPFVLS